jgi:hypothetical protein
VEEKPPENSRRAVLLAFVFTLASGTILALDAFVALPSVIAFLAAVGFLFSALAAGTIATMGERERRRRPNCCRSRSEDDGSLAVGVPSVASR